MQKTGKNGRANDLALQTNEPYPNSNPNSQQTFARRVSNKLLLFIIHNIDIFLRQCTMEQYRCSA